MMGTNIQAKIKAIKKAHQGRPDLAAYVVASDMAIVPIKMARYHQLEISLYACSECRKDTDFMSVTIACITFILR